MSKRLKKMICVLVGILLLAVVLGFFGNLGYVNMMHAMVSNVERDKEIDDNIRRIQIGSGDASIVGYVRSSNFSERKKVIIYLPGSGEIAYNATLEHGKQFADYVFASVDFPGAQDSTGKMNEASILNTGIQLYDYLVKQDYVDTNHIYIMGYSYSTGIVTYLASQRMCQKLVLVAPYRSSADMYNRYSPIYYGPMRLFITENFETEQYAQNVQVATLLITSGSDKTMNKRFAYALQSDFPHAEVKEYDGVSHDSYYNNSEVLGDIVSFLE
jgi:Dipeptidyl aminopeptidases/acylaminoacyl-peptidases